MLDEPFLDKKIFMISLFSTIQIWVLRVKKFFLINFLVDILPLGSWSVDLHIFVAPDPDPKHSFPCILKSS